MNDWPLAVCDASSVESADTQASDLIYPDHVAENALLCHNSNQRWFYLSNHLESEAIVFMQSDSLGAYRGMFSVVIFKSVVKLSVLMQGSKACRIAHLPIRKQLLMRILVRVLKLDYLCIMISK
jgi:hypothetical protein